MTRPSYFAHKSMLFIDTVFISACKHYAVSFKILQVINALNPDPLKQEPLLIENVPDPLAGEQVT